MRTLEQMKLYYDEPQLIAGQIDIPMFHFVSKIFKIEEFFSNFNIKKFQRAP